MKKRDKRKAIFLQSIFLFPGLLLIAMLLSGRLAAQEKAGLAVSNFGGVYNTILNPASPPLSKIFLDVNLLGADIFLENNFMFIHKQDYRLLDFISLNPELPVYGERGQGVDYYNTGGGVKGFQQVDIMGPSVSFTMGKQSVGIFTRARTITSIHDLPRDVAILLYEGLDFDSLYGKYYDHGAFDFSVAGWGELGFNYSRILTFIHDNEFAVGANIRFLFGYAGTTIKAQKLSYALLNDTTLDIQDMNADIGFSIPIDLESNEFPDNDPKFKGKGIAFDLGMTYVHRFETKTGSRPKRFCAYEFKDYIYKIGLSLRNLGQIKFRENAQQNSFTDVSVYWTDLDTVSFYNIKELTSTFSSVFYGDPNASFQSHNFHLGMPANLSFQADYQYYPNWYVNTVLVLPLKLSANQLHIPAQATVSLRYETSRFEVNIPFSFYDFRKPHLGMYVRFYVFSIGTDNLGGLFPFRDFTGMDLYMSVKFHLQKGFCSRYKPSKDCRHLAF